MQIVFALVALVVGFVLLVKGADWFVEGSAGIANKFGIPQIVIGLTIVAMGTSMPEAAVSISAALRGSAEITIGNVVGSNIMNILVILGLTAVVCQIAVQKTTIHYEIPMVIGSYGAAEQYHQQSRGCHPSGMHGGVYAVSSAAGKKRRCGE